jgi:hypothetical protein
MPVEAIHISAFLDSFARAELPFALRDGEGRAYGRLGCVAIDFPYFDRFPVGVARYLLERPTAVSEWGAALHHGTPARVAHSLLTRVHTLPDTQAARRLLAFALGFVSHLAVDANIHPFVNRQARARAARLGDSALRQHSEVEKFHSVLFHEERHGFDFMGTQALGRHIRVEGAALTGDAVLRDAYLAALRDALGKAPDAALLARWARGYGQYCWLVSTPAGKILMPERVKHEVREEVYRGAWGSFHTVYDDAVRASATAMEAAHRFAQSGDDTAFLRDVPQAAIDDLLDDAA